MTRAVWLACAWAACGTWDSGEPSAVPADAIFEVGFALEEAASNAEQDEALADEAWRRAVELFDREVEPGLRERRSALEVAELELRLSQFRALLTDEPGRAAREAVAIDRTLRAHFEGP